MHVLAFLVFLKKRKVKEKLKVFSLKEEARVPKIVAKEKERKSTNL